MKDEKMTVTNQPWGRFPRGAGVLAKRAAAAGRRCAAGVSRRESAGWMASGDIGKLPQFQGAATACAIVRRAGQWRCPRPARVENSLLPEQYGTVRIKKINL
jgi:hypothetical protein